MWSERVSSRSCATAIRGSNIVAIDYDPGASEVNQLNRIKLMLSTANKNLAKQNAPEQKDQAAG